ncbi:LexA family transcriptional regulator [Roseomonas xinghualingensis]|uniref:LexA family transcriptional regulator n=1 Tax=Roseomonas xinghualingensis TaxID=2986475 RepID=UPI0021F131BF|nr:LexA family transcriptional regulator [Roseomonas sp. SXEYE001]MCV4206891.1 helix-turn-helix domain-containing protein [Roseomonas sp. SXEYE001]
MVEISMHRSGIMEAELACEIGQGPLALTPKFIEGHVARVAIMATSVKANLAADLQEPFGQCGHMTTRLQEILDVKGVQAADLARMTDTDPSTLSKLVLGKRKLSQSWAQRFAEPLGVEPEELLAAVGKPISGKHAKLPPQRAAVTLEPPPPGYMLVKEYIADGAAGHGTEPVLDWQGRAEVVSEWIVPRDFLPAEHRHATVAVVRVQGDSMLPLLRPQDRVMVDVSQNWLGPDGTYLAWNGMGVVFKRLQALPGNPPKIRFSSDNPAYEAYTIPADEVRIFGRVIGHWNWL